MAYEAPDKLTDTALAELATEGEARDWTTAELDGWLRSQRILDRARAAMAKKETDHYAALDAYLDFKQRDPNAFAILGGLINGLESYDPVGGVGALRTSWVSQFPQYEAHWDFAKQERQDYDTAAHTRRVNELCREAKAKEDAAAKRADEKFAALGGKRRGLTSASAFLAEALTTAKPIWGDGDDVIMADGECLMICGGPGVGKTTIAGQFLRARLGFAETALGYTVRRTEKRVLYLACDRPKQVARALYRNLGDLSGESLDELLSIWYGPPRHDFAANQDALLELCAEANADTVIVDSLKDVAIGLSNDEVGSGYNRARQNALANGIQVVELHHQVKRGVNGSAPDTLSDVYGSTWLTAGAGSVVILGGDAGDPVVKFHHVKQPVDEIGPKNLVHDKAAGTSVFEAVVDLLALAAHEPLSALDAAKALCGSEKPAPAQKEKARRRLDQLASSGLLVAIPGDGGGPTRYAPRQEVRDWSPTTALADAPPPSWDAQQLAGD